MSIDRISPLVSETLTAQSDVSDKLLPTSIGLEEGFPKLLEQKESIDENESKSPLVSETLTVQSDVSDKLLPTSIVLEEGFPKLLEQKESIDENESKSPLDEENVTKNSDSDSVQEIFNSSNKNSNQEIICVSDDEFPKEKFATKRKKKKKRRKKTNENKSEMLEDDRPKKTAHSRHTGITGINFIIGLKTNSVDNKKSKPKFDCVACCNLPYAMEIPEVDSHVKSRDHLMNILELEDSTMFEACKNRLKVSDENLLEYLIAYENLCEKEHLNKATDINYVEIRNEIVNKIAEIKKSNDNLESIFTKVKKDILLEKPIDENKSVEQKNAYSKHITGISFIIGLKLVTGENKPKLNFDCVACNKTAFYMDGLQINSHVKTREHVMNILEIEDKATFEACNNGLNVSDTNLLEYLIEFENLSAKKNLNTSTTETHSQVRQDLLKIIYERKTTKVDADSFNGEEAVIDLDALSYLLPDYSWEAVFSEMELKLSNRCPMNILLVMDDRDQLTKLNTECLQRIQNFSVLKIPCLSYKNAMEYLLQHPLFDKGTVYLICSSIFSFVENTNSPHCKGLNCSEEPPRIFQYETESVVLEAAKFATKILHCTSNDFVIFSDVVPMDILTVNQWTLQNSSCTIEHIKLDEYNGMVQEHIKNVHIFNEFVNIFAKKLNLQSLTLEKEKPRTKEDLFIAFDENCYSFLHERSYRRADKIQGYINIFHSNIALKSANPVVLNNSDNAISSVDKIHFILLVSEDIARNHEVYFDITAVKHHKITFWGLEHANSIDWAQFEKELNIWKTFAHKKTFVLIPDLLMMTNYKQSSLCGYEKCKTQSAPILSLKNVKQTMNINMENILKDIQLFCGKNSRVLLSPILPRFVILNTYSDENSLHSYAHNLVNHKNVPIILEGNKADWINCSEKLVLEWEYFIMTNETSISSAISENCYNHESLLWLPASNYSIDTISVALQGWKTNFESFFKKLNGVEILTKNNGSIMQQGSNNWRMGQMASNCPASYGPMYDEQSYFTMPNPLEPPVNWSVRGEIDENGEKLITSLNKISPSIARAKFHHVIIVGNKNLLDRLSDIRVNSTFIHYDLGDLNKDTLHGLIKKLGNKISRPSSVCCLVFGVSLVMVSNDKVPKSCNFYKCTFPMTILNVREDDVGKSDSPITTITKHLEKVVTFVKDLSDYIAVMVLPLYPTRLYCDDVSSDIQPKEVHSLLHEDMCLFVTEISPNTLREYFMCVNKIWNNLLDVYHRRMPFHRLIYTFIESGVNFLCIEYPTKEFCIKSCKETLWKAFVSALLYATIMEGSISMHQSTGFYNVPQYPGFQPMPHDIGFYRSPHYSNFPPMQQHPRFYPMEKFEKKYPDRKVSKEASPVRKRYVGTRVISSRKSTVRDTQISIEKSRISDFQKSQMKSVKSNLTWIKIWNYKATKYKDFVKDFLDCLDSNFKLTEENDEVLEVGFLLKNPAILAVSKLNGARLGDVTLKAAFKENKDTDIKLTDTLQIFVNYIYQNIYDKSKFWITRLTKERLESVIDVLAFKSVKCSSRCRKKTSQCINFHNEFDFRRNPLTTSYSVERCLNLCSRDCGPSCIYSHNQYEVTYFPTQFQTKLCPNKERDYCDAGSMCQFAHKDTPEIILAKDREDLLVFGAEHSLQFLAGAIRATSKVPAIRHSTLTSVLFVSPSSNLLHIAAEAVKKICFDFCLKMIHLGDNIKEILVDQQVVLCEPKHLANIKVGHLQFGAIIVDDIKAVLTFLEFRDLIREMLFITDKFHKIFVCNDYESTIHGAIFQVLQLNLKEVKVIAEPLRLKTKIVKRSYSSSSISSDDDDESSSKGSKSTKSRRRRSRSRSKRHKSEKAKSKSSKKRSSRSCSSSSDSSNFEYSPYRLLNQGSKEKTASKIEIKLTSEVSLINKKLYELPNKIQASCSKKSLDSLQFQHPSEGLTSLSPRSTNTYIEPQQFRDKIMAPYPKKSLDSLQFQHPSEGFTSLNPRSTNTYIEPQQLRDKIMAPYPKKSLDSLQFQHPSEGLTSLNPRSTNTYIEPQQLRDKIMAPYPKKSLDSLHFQHPSEGFTSLSPQSTNTYIEPQQLRDNKIKAYPKKSLDSLQFQHPSEGIASLSPLPTNTNIKPQQLRDHGYLQSQKPSETLLSTDHQPTNYLESSEQSRGNLPQLSNKIYLRVQNAPRDNSFNLSRHNQLIGNQSQLQKPSDHSLFLGEKSSSTSQQSSESYYGRRQASEYCSANFQKPLDDSQYQSETLTNFPINSSQSAEIYYRRHQAIDNYYTRLQNHPDNLPSLNEQPINIPISKSDTIEENLYRRRENPVQLQNPSNDFSSLSKQPTSTSIEPSQHYKEEGFNHHQQTLDYLSLQQQNPSGNALSISKESTRRPLSKELSSRLQPSLDRAEPSTSNNQQPIYGVKRDSLDFDLGDSSHSSHDTLALSELSNKSPANHDDKALSDMLGEVLYAKYRSISEKIEKEVQEEYNLFKRKPKLHQHYEQYNHIFYTKFSLKYNTSDMNNEKSRMFLWAKFWENCCIKLQEDDLKMRLKIVHDQIIEKKRILDIASKPKINMSERFSVAKALDLIEELCPTFGVAGSALLSIVNSCRDLGTTNHKAIGVFVAKENLVLVNLFMDKLRSLKKKSSPTTIVEKYNTAILWTERLVKSAKEEVSPRSIDIKAIAQATIGKDPSFVIDMIRTACVYEGDAKPSHEKINHIFLEVCKIHLDLASS